MTKASEIQQLREEVLELRLLYKKLAESMIPTVKPTPEEVESIESPDETVSEEEFLRLLSEHNDDVNG